MKIIFTKQEGLDNKGCYDKEKALSLSFMKKESFTVEDLINSEIPLKDKYWFICRKCELSKEQNQQIAIDIAEIVLPIYEKKYPDNKAPREAIEAAKLFIAGHISLDKLIEKRNAAYAYAAAAADAAAADAAAAYAAAAAAAAAATYAAAAAAAVADTYAAAAADAAAAAAADAAAAYAYASIKQKLQHYLFNFIKSQL